MILRPNQNNNPQNNNTNLEALSLIARAKKDPAGLYKELLQSNPQFKRFIENSKGKTKEEIARENGIDLGILNQLLK